MRSLISSLLVVASAFFATSVARAQPSAKAAPPAASAAATTPATVTAEPTAIPYPTLNPEFDDNFQVMNPLALSGRIAFSATIDSIDRILVLDLNAGRVQKLIEGPGNNFYPSWSHDGTQVVFTSDRDGNKEIYVANWDGSNQRRLTTNQVNDDNPTWTPDDKHIVYYSSSKPGDDSNTNLYMVSVAGGQPVKLTNFTGRNTTPRVSPDGNQIAYSTDRFWPGWDVCIWNLASKSESCPLQGKASYCRAAWSPSGKLFAYSYGTLNMVDIGFFSFSDKDRRTLTDMSGKEYDATWSPSESLIAFASEADTSGVFNLYVVDMQKKVTPLLKSSYSSRYPSWTGVKTFELEARRLREAAKREEEERASAAATAAAAAAVTAVPATVTP